MNELFTINITVVSSTIYSGQDYKSIKQFSVYLNITCMSNPIYQRLRETMGKKMKSIAQKVTEEAAIEKVQLAYENRDVSKDGIPMISVVVDEAWSKRSYWSRCNTLFEVVSKTWNFYLIFFNHCSYSYTTIITHNT